MRGKVFHNHMVKGAEAVFTHFNWLMYLEHCVRRNGVTTYFDLLAVMPDRLLGCEIETSSRHIIENAQKANAVAIPVWFIVPTRKVRNLAAAKIKQLDITPGGEPIKLLLPSQLEQELMNYLPLTIQANSRKSR